MNWGGQLNLLKFGIWQNFTFLQVAMSNLVVSHEPWRESENLAKKSGQEEKMRTLVDLSAIAILPKIIKVPRARFQEET